MTLLVTLLAFTSGFLLVFGVNLFLLDATNRHRRALQERLEGEVRVRQRDRARNVVIQNEDLAALALAGETELTPELSWWTRFERWIEQSGLDLQAGSLIVICFASGLLPALGLFLWRPVWLVAAVVGVAASTLPLLYVGQKRLQRRERLLSQLSDAFDLMSRALRAGQTISQAMQAVADEFSPPIAEEFAYCYEQQNLGLSPDVALRELARRTDLLEVKIFVVAVTVHRQTGGNLSQLLDKLSDVIRDRYRIRGQIRALTAEGRLQAAILLALPPVLLVLLMFLNRDYVMTLFQVPSLLVGMFVFEAIGALWLRKIVNFDF